ncbi:ovochymase-1 isoform 1-T1 [Clarias gariepinus]
MFGIICLVFVVINSEVAGKITTLDRTLVYNGNTSLYGVRTFRQKDKEEAGPRIVGGKEAWLHSWPWQVVLSCADVPVCGGAILNMYWILTASHCFRRNARESFWEVWAGKHDLDNDTESCQQNVKVAKIITHEDYNSITKQHDIALLRLHTPLVFDECVRPVSPWSGDLPSLKRCTITGWGSTTQGGPHANRLQEANITILKFDTCVRFYGGIIRPSMVCAGEMAGGLDACQGDSGGPLSCFTGTQYEVAGIVSWGVGCGHAQKPGVYTKVAFYIQWINSIIGGRFGADGSWKVLTDMPIISSLDVSEDGLETPYLIYIFVQYLCIVKILDLH